MGDTKPTLYFDPNQTQSRRVLIALEDLGFDCHLVILDELLGENLSKSWFTQLGTQGRFPCLTTGDKQTIVGSTDIIKYMDNNKQMLFFNEPNIRNRVDRFMRLFDEDHVIVNMIGSLLHGVAVFHQEEFTKILRWPYCDESMRRKIVAYYQRVGANVTDRNLRSLKIKLEGLFDELEKELGREDRHGPWLCGPFFSVADISLVELLVSMWQIGWDDVLWNHGERPHVAVYAEMAMNRPSVIRALGWKNHASNYMTVKTEAERNADMAKVGVGLAAVLGGLYILRKVWK